MFKLFLKTILFLEVNQQIIKMRTYKKHEQQVKDAFNSFYKEGSSSAEYAKKKLNEAFNISNETLYESEIVSKVKVGDIFVMKDVFKNRPAVVCKIDRDVCKVICLTTSEGYMNTGIKANSRFFYNDNQSYYGYNLTLVPASTVAKFFIGCINTPKEVRDAYKHVVEYYAKNLKL